MSNIYIRRADTHDLFSLEGLSRRGIAEAEGNLPPYDFLHAAHVTLNLCAAGLVFVACEPIDEKREKVVGALCLDVKSWHWNPEVKYLESVHFYVMAEARTKSLADGGSIAAGLLAAGKALADAANTPLIMGVFFGADRASTKDAFIEQHGFTRMGGRHLYMPTAQDVPQAEAAE